ncbi:MAG: hypothetical protein ACI8W8_001887 [Rhodothermales bacterium]|jgi:hypothetical protein
MRCVTILFLFAHWAAASSTVQPANRQIHCLDLQSGEVMWTYGEAMSQPSISANEDLVRVEDYGQTPRYLELNSGSVVAPPAGRMEEKSARVNRQFGDNGVVPVERSKRSAYARVGSVYSPAGEWGWVNWRFDSWVHVPTPESPIVVSARTDYHDVYLVMDEHVFALNSGNGALNWHTSLHAQPGDPFGDNVSAAMTITTVGGLLVFCGDQVVMLDPENGQIRWTYFADTPAWFRARIVGERLLIAATPRAKHLKASAQKPASKLGMSVRWLLLRAPIWLLMIPLLFSAVAYAGRRTAWIAPGPWCSIIALGLVFSWPLDTYVLTSGMALAHYLLFFGYLCLMLRVLWQLRIPQSSPRALEVVTWIGGVVLGASLAFFFAWCRVRYP